MAGKPNYYFFVAAVITSEKERDRFRNLFNDMFPDKPEMIRRDYVHQQNAVSTFSFISDSIINWESISKFRDEVLDSSEATVLEVVSNCPELPPIEIEGWKPSAPKPSFCFSITALNNFKWSWMDWFRPSPQEVLIKRIEDQFFHFEEFGRYSCGMNLSGHRISFHLESPDPIEEGEKKKVIEMFKSPNITILSTFEN